MTNIPSGLLDYVNDPTRNPTAKLEVSWGNVLVSGEWFRLDQSELDSGSILSQENYLEDEAITEIITDADAKVYVDESEHIIMLEGYSELIGDNLQYAISDFDCDLDNTNNRFTPRENKNKLVNQSFEYNKNNWHENFEGDSFSEIDATVARTDIRSLRIDNQSTDIAYIFSDRITLNDDDPINFSEDWVFSQYLRGEGTAYLQLHAFSLVNSGVQNISTGLLQSSTVACPLVSGEWTRFETSLQVASGGYYLRGLISLSGSFLYADDGQIEESLTATVYDPSFIGDLILPKRPIKLQAGFSNVNVKKFSGLIERLTPKLKEDTIHIYAYDWATSLKDYKIEETYYENLRTDEIIQQLASTAGVDSSKISLEQGLLTIEFAWLPEGSIWYYMTQVAETEGGMVFFDEEGVLTFWNRTHFSVDDPVVHNFTFAENIMNFDYEVSKDRVKNRIEVKANPKKKLENKTIYSVQDIQSIAPGETQEIWCQFFYGREDSVSALNVEVPTIGTDILGNAQQDGGGADLSAYLAISSYSIFRESIKLNILNSHPSTTIYLTKVNITGDPIVIKSRIESIKENATSRSLYGTQILAIENDLLDDSDYAETLATQRLTELKDPQDFVRIEAIGVPYLKVGDKVNVERSFDGVKEDFYVVANRWQQHGDFVQNLELQKKVIYNS